MIHIILVGEAGSGKSRIQKLIKSLLEEHGIVCENKTIYNGKFKIPKYLDHVIQIQPTKQNETTTTN